MVRKLKRHNKQKNKPVFSLPEGATIQRRPGSGPKMSDTMVEFAKPILDDMPEDAGAQEWERCLLSAAAIWNGAVANNEDKVIETLETMLGSDLETRQMLEALFERKRRLFSHDTRMILDVRAQDTPKGVQVFAASVPFSGRK